MNGGAPSWILDVCRQRNADMGLLAELLRPGQPASESA